MQPAIKDCFLLMGGACVNPYGCEWSIGYFWRLMTWIGHLDVIVLTLLLVYTVVVVMRVCFRCPVGRHSMDTDSASRRRLSAELTGEVGNLKSISFVAPYLGLVGTCFGIMSAFRGIGMEKHAALAIMSSLVAAALITTAAGIIVAVPAICSYNYLRARLDMFENQMPTQRLPLTPRFSAVPGFALIAAPLLGIVVAAFMAFGSFHASVGLLVKPASAGCERDIFDRVIVQITDRGTVSINAEQQNWSSLPVRLSEIYTPRVHRTLYLTADDGVRFQNVTDAIDIVRNTRDRLNAHSLDITVRLIRPNAKNRPALKAACPNLDSSW